MNPSMRREGQARKHQDKGDNQMEGSLSSSFTEDKRGGSFLTISFDYKMFPYAEI